MSKTPMSKTLIDDLRRRIIAQADAMGDTGWMEIPVPASVSPDEKLRAPRGAFEMWCVGRTGGRHLAQPWQPISPRGVKQGGDDPYHTDWMLGAGLDPLDMNHRGNHPHWEQIREAASHARAALETSMLGANCSVLLAGPAIEGRVVHPKNPGAVPEDSGDLPPIAVIADSRTEWLDLALAVLDQGGAIIVEQGGGTAHLIGVLRGQDRGPVIRKPDALALYPEGSTVAIDPKAGRIRFIDDPDLVSAAMSTAIGDTCQKDNESDITSSPVRKTKATSTAIKLTELDHRHPDENLNYILFGRQIEGPSHDVRCYLLCDDTETERQESVFRGIWYREIPRDRIATLRIIVTKRGDYPSRRRFYSQRRAWSDTDIDKACLTALFIVDPDAEFAAERAAKKREDKHKAKMAALRALDTEALLDLTKHHGIDEYGLIDNFESGFLDIDDLADFRRHFESLFFDIDMILIERGLEITSDDLRPMLKEPTPNAYITERRVPETTRPPL